LKTWSALTWTTAVRRNSTRLEVHDVGVVDQVPVGVPTLLNTRKREGIGSFESPKRKELHVGVGVLLPVG